MGGATDIQDIIQIDEELKPLKTKMKMSFTGARTWVKTQGLMKVEWMCSELVSMSLPAESQELMMDELVRKCTHPGDPCWPARSPWTRTEIMNFRVSILNFVFLMHT